MEDWKIRMKILLSANVIFTVINFRRELIVALLEDGHEIHVLASMDDRYNDLMQYNVKYHKINMNKIGTKPLQDYKLLRSYKEIYKEINPDIILHFTIKPNIYGSLAASKLNIPVVNNVTGLGRSFRKKSLLNKIVRILYKKAFKTPKKIFFQNTDDMNLFLESKLVKKEKCDLLPGSGVNLLDFQVDNKEITGVRVFLMVARVTKSKGVLQYIEVATRIKNNGGNARFLLVGDIPEDGEDGISRESVNKWHNSGTIEYLGFSQDIKKQIAMADCIVLPSYYREGVPRSLLEGLAMGKPIITTDNVGCKETVINNINGYMVKCKSSDSLYDAIDRFAHLSEEEIKNMGTESRALAERKFDVNIVIDKYKNIINN